RLHKGSAVMVEGRLVFREWEAKEGGKRNRLELSARRVQSLEATGEAAPKAQGSVEAQPQQAQESFAAPAEVDADASLEEVAF
ncbi:MAG: single-stranded DNA-binding protein, partial [Elusimicrobiota bacterium]